MQDLRAMGSGGGGRIFGGDRRLRPHTNQALKCPRCDSLNTKFCYYNNYNLSQPRHFCKSCRRYWTKGGVLRNVPVGGGCRKTKRSKAKPSTEVQKEKKSSSHSSSESSNLTATTTTTGTATDAVSVASSSSAAAAAAAVVPNFHDSRFFFSQNPIPNFEPSMMETLDQTSDGGIFAETGTFTSLMTAVNPNPTFLGFNFSDFSPIRLHQQQQQQQQQQQKMSSMVEELKLQELTAASFLDQTVPVELPGLPGRGATTGNGGINALEWQNCGDQQGLFDLGSSNGVEQGYWSHNQWNESENDHSLYLP